MYLYFVSSGKGGPIKIGVAKDVDKRVETLQTGNPLELIIIAKVKCKGKAHAYSLENHLHRFYSGNKIRREWFNANINLSHADRIVSTITIESDSETKKIEQELDMKAIINSPLQCE